jgi:hypothetical protein
MQPLPEAVKLFILSHVDLNQLIWLDYVSLPPPYSPDSNKNTTDLCPVHLALKIIQATVLEK